LRDESVLGVLSQILLIWKCLSLSLFSFLQYQGLNSGPSPWATSPALFLWWGFWRTICPGRPWTEILLISASWVARITDVSHWLLVKMPVLLLFLFIYLKTHNTIYLTSKTFQHSKHTKNNKRLQIGFKYRGSWTFIFAVVLCFADNEEFYSLKTV
jgi:hypothetical protein